MDEREHPSAILVTAEGLTYHGETYRDDDRLRLPLMVCYRVPPQERITISPGFDADPEPDGSPGPAGGEVAFSFGRNREDEPVVYFRVTSREGAFGRNGRPLATARDVHAALSEWCEAALLHALTKLRGSERTDDIADALGACARVLNEILDDGGIRLPSDLYGRAEAAVAQAEEVKRG